MDDSESVNCNAARRDREDDPRPNGVLPGVGEADACRGISLHTSGKSVEEAKESEKPVGYVLKVKPCRCRSWFCSKRGCLKASGRALLNRLIPVLETFDGMMMLTLTVDPKLFESPRSAFDYLKARRCVAELIRALSKSGHLRSRRFFYVVEWQTETLMPHFHVLVESSFIPFDDLKRLWNRFRPKSAGPPIGNAPGFGHVRISKRSFANPSHASRYACKYLTKPPKEGYPAWVLNYVGQIKRFSTSRGLLKEADAVARERPRSPEHVDGCPCTDCKKKKRPKSTVSDRVRTCGNVTMLVRIPELVGKDGEIYLGRPLFEARAPMPYADVAWLLSDDEDFQSSYIVTREQWDELIKVLDAYPRHTDVSASTPSLKEWKNAA